MVDQVERRARDDSRELALELARAAAAHLCERERAARRGGEGSCEAAVGACGWVRATLAGACGWVHEREHGCERERVRERERERGGGEGAEAEDARRSCGRTVRGELKQLVRTRWTHELRC